MWLAGTGMHKQGSADSGMVQHAAGQVIAQVPQLCGQVQPAAAGSAQQQQQQQQQHCRCHHGQHAASYRQSHAGRATQAVLQAAVQAPGLLPHPAGLHGPGGLPPPGTATPWPGYPLPRAGLPVLSPLTPRVALTPLQVLPSCRHLHSGAEDAAHSGTAVWAHGALDLSEDSPGLQEPQPPHAPPSLPPADGAQNHQHFYQTGHLPTGAAC
jgi:hypothetical protein